ncbi:hypothetical protein FQS88_14360 [Enterococcus casseliflavus]|nr:hypothetical protein [Enterococcus casseliflavus]
MPVVKDEISLVKVANGDDGRGILGTPVATYAQSTSGTIPPTTWSATRPNVPAGQYLWTRVVTTYTDNTTSETQTPTLMGKPGDPGLGIKSKSISYTVGTTGNTPPTSGWQETIPTVSANQYLWTKTTLIYTDESKTEAYSVGKMGADGANAKLLYLTASAENMAFNADDTPKTTQTINISAKLQNVTGTATFAAIPYIGNTAQTAITLGGTGNTRTLTSAQWTNKNWTLIAITATLDNLSDTLSIVKVKDGKEGETYYPHHAWLMADGRFTTTYPNENIILNTLKRSMSAYLGATLNHDFNYNMTEEWGVANATRVTGTVGTNRIFGLITASNPQHPRMIVDLPYTHSIYLKNLNDKRVTVSFNNGQSAVTLESGESRYLTSSSIGDGNRAVQFVFQTIDTNEPTFDIVFYGPKIENDNHATIYTPAPSEDLVNAYPKYEGFYSDTNQVGSDHPDDYKPWTPFMGPEGPEGDKGDSAPLISLSGATQAITVDKDGKITPATSFTVTGTAVNTSISNWTYSLNGGNFGSAVPTGVTRSGNTVTINPATATFNQLTIRAADATVSDVYTISRIKDGGDGAPGSDAYTVFLTNESYTFAGSTSAALAGSTTTEVVVYKGINKITPTSVVVGTKPTGLSSSVSGSVVTFTAATTLVTKSGTVPITITVDGKTFTKQFAFAISFQGDPGISITGTEVQFVQTSSMTEPTSGWSTTRPTPVPGQWLWTRTRNKFSNNTYSDWVAVPTLIGREAIVVSDTAPSNPSKGTLWQTPSDPNVKQWDGATWIDWGIAPENIAADNLVVKDGRFDKLIGTELEGGVITNPFDYWNGEYVSGSNDQLWRRGQTIIEKSETTTMWEDYNKTTGVKIKEGGVVHNSDGVIVFVNDPANYNQRASYTTSGIRLADSRGLGDLTSSFLTYNDLVTVNVTGINAASGWERYAATGISAPTASRTARMVQLSGAFKPTNDIPGSADQVTMNSQLPLWARPKEEITLVQQGSGMNRYRLTITTDGYITMSRYGTTTYATAIKNAYLNISVAYAGADIF